MTEREKMQHGLLYDANYDAELLAERARCKDLCFAYNQLQPSLVAQQEEIIRRLLGKTGQRFCITAPFWCDDGCNIEIGENSFIGARVSILPGTTIGKNCIIGACTVVKGNIPDNSICIGNPCQIIGNSLEYAKKHFEKKDYFEGSL